MEIYYPVDVILPDVTLAPESKSSHLTDELFSVYLDTILQQTYTHTDICEFTSVFISDYFMTIDFVQLGYVVPNKLLNALQMCETSFKRFYVIPIRLNLTYDSSHSNVVMIDNEKLTIEYFEPHGGSIQDIGFPYDIEYHVKNLIQHFFPIKFNTYTFINVQSTCPIGLQSLQNSVNPNSGHCLAWSLLFIKVRTDNLLLSTDYIIHFLTTTFTNVELDKLIKKFIGMLEKTSPLHLKLVQNIRLQLIISPTETLKISNRINILTTKYIAESAKINPNQKRISSIFKRLISYHKFPKFNDIFFKAMNTYLHSYDSKTESQGKNNTTVLKRHLEP